MSKAEIALWCALLAGALLIGCREERRLVEQEEELLRRQREPWTVWPSVDYGFGDEAADESCFPVEDLERRLPKETEGD